MLVYVLADICTPRGVDWFSQNEAIGFFTTRRASFFNTIAAQLRAVVAYPCVARVFTGPIIGLETGSTLINVSAET